MLNAASSVTDVIIEERYFQNVISSEILMLDLLKSLCKRKHVVKVLYILLVEAMTPKMFKKITLKNTENQSPTNNLVEKAPHSALSSIPLQTRILNIFFLLTIVNCKLITLYLRHIRIISNMGNLIIKSTEITVRRCFHVRIIGREIRIFSLKSH